MQITGTQEIKERVLLLGVQTQDGDDTDESVEELGDLARTAGAEVVGALIQRRENIHPGTYIGKGKIEEVRGLLYEKEATGIVCDDELSPAQLNNLQQELDCKVIDRTLLILDIFARHATSREGKLQVELAQLRYRAERLGEDDASALRQLSDDGGRRRDRVRRRAVPGGSYFQEGHPALPQKDRLRFSGLPAVCQQDCARKCDAWADSRPKDGESGGRSHRKEST